MSRTPSTRTVTQSRYPSSQHDHRPFRSSFGSHQRKPVVLDDITGESPSPPMASSSSSAISSSSDERPTHPSVAKSQVFRRPPDLRTISSEGDAEDDDDDDDDDSSAGFLPFASREHNVPTSLDPAATLRRPSATDRSSQIRQQALSPPISSEAPNDQRRRSSATEQQRTGARPSPPPQQQPLRGTERPALAARATTSPPMRPGTNPGMLRNQSAKGAGALSPRHRAEVLSGRQSKGSSEGTPSMGSSFSDLDGEWLDTLLHIVPILTFFFSDASVTQSALDDAILSTMQNAGAASRMSTFSQALRSKYLPQ